VYSVSYVAISGQVIEKVVREAREHPDGQVVGVLLGGQSGSTIMIEDAATGPAESDATKATLTGDSIAGIADDIINKRIRGSIVGWYHSHVRGGVFMSETDVETQLKLQQFSPLVTAMVIDAQTGSSGLFRVDPKTKETVSVSVRTETRQEAMPLLAPQAAYPQTMYPQASAPPAPAPISTRAILIAVLLITLAIVGGLVALVYYRVPGIYGAGTLSITHNQPQPPFMIGNAITFDANVTNISNLANVTLTYRIMGLTATSGGGLVWGDAVSVPMLLKASCSGSVCPYSYTLPPSEASGVFVQYQISAYDTSSPPTVARTETYLLNLGYFDWGIDKTEVTIVRTIPSEVSIRLSSINGFNKPVTIRIVTTAPLGVDISPVSNQVAPPNSAVLRITSTDNAQIVQKDDVEIDAIYSVGAIQIIRSTILELTVTDFSIGVEPGSLTAKTCTDVQICATPGYDASYTLTLTIYQGMNAPNGIKVSVTGLPNLITYQLILVSDSISTQGTETLTYNLRVHVQPGLSTSLPVLYVLTVTATAGTTGGTISHTFTDHTVVLNVTS
jgi:proteasome lid subunit RPN8/RPN11